MREIKFRALDQFSDTWIIGQAFFIDSDNGQGYIANRTDDHHCVRKETVGQYAGIKDNWRTEECPEGQEIYEGDVLLDETTGWRAEVKWYEHGLWVENYKGDQYMPNEEWRRVIGNVHESPGLLESVD